MKTLAILVAVLAVAFAQLYPTTVTPLTSGSKYDGSFPANTGDVSVTALQVFSLAVPENVTNIVLSIADTTADSTSYCYFNFYIASSYIPCDATSETDLLVPCDSYYMSNYVYYQGSDDWEIYPYTSARGSIILGSNVYITVSLDLEDYVCTFSITPTVSECATAGQIAEFDTSSATPSCFAVTPITIVNGTGTISSVSLADASGYSYYKFNVPVGVPAIHIVGNVSAVGSADADLDFQFGITPGYSGSAGSISFTYGSTTDGYWYYYDDYITNPVSGTVYLGLNNVVVSSGWITVTFESCDAGLGGANCEPVHMITDLVTPLNQAVNLTNNGDYVGEYFVIQTSTPSLNFYNFTAAITSLTSGGDLYVYYAKDYFPSTSTYYEEDSTSTQGTAITVALTPADFVVPGSYVFGVRNYGNSDSAVFASVTSSSSSVGPSTTGDATGAATGAATDASTTGSASSVAYCFALIALCIAALF